MTKKRKLKPDELLMASIGFDEADLEANHAGQLGPNQRERLQRMRQTAQVNGSVASGIGLLLILGGLGLTVIGFLGAIGLVIVGLIFMAGGMQVFLRNGRWILRTGKAQLLDQQEGRVERIEGRVSLDVQTAGGRGNAAEYTVRLEGRDWSVTREVFLAFKNGDPYALYYAPRSGVVLAAEWLREPPPEMGSPADAEDVEQVDMQEKPKHGSMRQ
jgi:hypothetical protein